MTRLCHGIDPIAAEPAICDVFLESNYLPTLCPRCISDAVLTEAVAAAKWDVRCFGAEFVTESFMTVIDSADDVLNEKPSALARHSGRAVA